MAGHSDLASSDFAKGLKTTVCQSCILVGKEHFTGRALQGEAQLFPHAEGCLCTSGLTQRLRAAVPAAAGQQTPLLLCPLQ